MTWVEMTAWWAVMSMGVLCFALIIYITWRDERGTYPASFAKAFDRIDIDVDQIPRELRGEAMEHSAGLCRQCPSRPECRRWLTERFFPVTAYRNFCPNRELFDILPRQERTAFSEWPFRPTED